MIACGVRDCLYLEIRRAVHILICSRVMTLEWE